MKRVFICLRLPAAGSDLLRERYQIEEVEAEGMPEKELASRVRQLDPEGMVGMVNVPITGPVMDAAPRLRCIANYAVGYNNIDLGEATRRGRICSWAATCTAGRSASSASGASARRSHVARSASR